MIDSYDTSHLMDEHERFPDGCKLLLKRVGTASYSWRRLDVCGGETTRRDVVPRQTSQSEE